jgi:hypothetical protein
MSQANCPSHLIGDLPDDPGCALNYHYGMLLGATDLRTEQGFHVGKQRRHARSLHGRGVVQGLQVRLVPERRELRVLPGLALDARGRELVLSEPHCLSLAAWWREQRERPEFAEQRHLDVVRLQLLLTLEHRVCAERPVPAIAPACSTWGSGDGDGAMQASRLCESAQLALRDGSAWLPAHSVPAAELPLYALLGIAPALPAGDDEVDWALAARAAVAAALPENRVAAALTALDQAIALSTARLDPSAPEGVDALPLALLRDLVLKREGADEWIVDGGRLEWLDRPALLDTSTLQRLLAALLASSAPLVAAPVVPVPAPPPPPPPPPPAAPAAAALRELISSAQFDAERLTMELAEPVHSGSAQPSAFAIAELDDAHGWRSFSVRHVDVEAGGRRLLLTLGHAPHETLVRVVIDLAGRKPLLAADRSELAERYRNRFTLTF